MAERPCLMETGAVWTTKIVGLSLLGMLEM